MKNKTFKKIYHEIKNGENQEIIAKKHNVEIDDLEEIVFFVENIMGYNYETRK